MKEQLKKAKAIIEGYDGPAVRVMEVCGTHTHEIFHLGVRKILPPQVELISGPGCPVCVTPAGFIDEAIWLALEKNVTVFPFKLSMIFPLIVFYYIFRFIIYYI